MILAIVMAGIFKILIKLFYKVSVPYKRLATITVLTFISSYLISVIGIYTLIYYGQAQQIYIMPIFSFLLCIMILLFMFSKEIRKNC